MDDAFSVENVRMKLIRRPCEEYARGGAGTGVVVDGITRDCRNGKPVQKDLKGAINTFLFYPRPSPAAVAANLAGEAIHTRLNSCSVREMTQGVMREAFREGNDAVKSFNRDNFSHYDFVVNDLAGCVASAFFRDLERVIWGYITDCGVAAFHVDGEMFFQTESEGPDKYSKHFKEHPEATGLSWKDARFRELVRKEFRNNPSNPHAYGALTGQRETLLYVRVGEIAVLPSDTVVAYSDGLEPVVSSGRFVDTLRQGKKSLRDLCRRSVKTEGSFAYIAPESL